MELAEMLWEIEQIKQLKARFFRLMDTKQWEQWADCFTVDVQVDIDVSHENDGGRVAPRKPSMSGRDTLLHWRSSSTDIGISRHHGHTPEIEITSPTTAMGIWA